MFSRGSPGGPVAGRTAVLEEDWSTCGLSALWESTRAASSGPTESTTSTRCRPSAARPRSSSRPCSHRHHAPDSTAVLGTTETISTAQTPKRSVPASTRDCRKQRRAGFRASRVMRKSSTGGVKTTFVYLTISRSIDFLAFHGQESHGRNQGKEAIRRCGFLYKPVADPLFRKLGTAFDSKWRLVTRLLTLVANSRRRQIGQPAA